MTKKGSYTSYDVFEIIISIFNVLCLGILFGYTVKFIINENTIFCYFWKVSKIGSIFSELSKSSKDLKY